MVSEHSQFAIETVSLTKVFPDWWGRAKVVAVDNLDLQIKHNEVYGLLGPNGSGKTTTIKILLSLLHATKGAAYVLGGSSRESKVSSRVGYLPEESYLYKYLTARETLDFYGRIFGLAAKTRKGRIDTLLDMVGLTPMANRAVGTYSKGMARRIGLAQALINDPDVLVLDEPTSGMDPIGTRQMKDLILELAERGKTILLCSHLLADVEDVCDRIGILYGGRMQMEGPVDSLLKKTDETQILASGLSSSALEKIQSIIEAEKADCSITSPMDKLEDFFIRTVAEAQRRKEPTSGAVNSGKISGFLKEEHAESDDVLEKLVNASVDEIVSAKVETTTEAGEVVKKAKKSVLDELTQSTVADVESDSPRPTVPLDDGAVSTSEIKEDVLNKLIGESKDE